MKTITFEQCWEFFDFLNDIPRIDEFLCTLTEEQREKIYSHPIVDEIPELLP